MSDCVKGMRRYSLTMIYTSVVVTLSLCLQVWEALHG